MSIFLSFEIVLEIMDGSSLITFLDIIDEWNLELLTDLLHSFKVLSLWSLCEAIVTGKQIGRAHV